MPVDPQRSGQGQAKIMGKGTGIQVPDFYDDFCLVIGRFCGKNRVVKILKEKPDGFSGFFPDIGVPHFILDNVLVGNKIPDGLFVSFLICSSSERTSFSGVLAPQPVSSRARKKKGYSVFFS